MRTLLTAALLILFAGTGRAAGYTVVQAEDDRPVRIMCYGDSNTYGYDPEPGRDRYPESGRWPCILQQMLGDSYQIIEEGKNGRKTGYPDSTLAAAYEEGPLDLQTRLEKNQPVDMLIIMLGTNDCVPGAGLSAEEIAAGMEALVTAAEDQADAAGIPRPSIAIVVPAAFGSELLDLYPSRDIEETIEKSHRIGDLYEEIADRHNCLFVDARNGIETSLLDHSHLTENGHRQLASLIFNTIFEEKT